MTIVMFYTMIYFIFSERALSAFTSSFCVRTVVMQLFLAHWTALSCTILCAEMVPYIIAKEFEFDLILPANCCCNYFLYLYFLTYCIPLKIERVTFDY